MKEKDVGNAGGRSLRRWEGLGWGHIGTLVLERGTWVLVESLLIPPESSVKKGNKVNMWQEASRRDEMAATVVSSIMPAFQAGGKGKKKWKKRDIFPRNSPAAFCLDFIGQNWIAWPPLAAREAGKSGPGFSRSVDRRAHCLIKCSQSLAKRRKGACLPCPSMPVPRSALPCPAGGCASLKNAQAATVSVWSLQVFYITGH